jgi:hypothetical protein
VLVSRSTAPELNSASTHTGQATGQTGTQAPVGQTEPSLKEKLAQKRKAAKFRKELTNFVVFAAFFAILVGTPLAVIGGPKVAVGAVVGILCLAASYKYPRQALWAFLVYLPFGGTITYTIGNSPLLQLAKDGLYLPAAFAMYQNCKRERLPIFIPKALMPSLGTLLASSLLTLLIVNGYQEIFGKPSEKPIAMGILGLKVLIGYMPLLVCTYYLVRNKKEFLFLMRLTLVLALICCGLGFVQYLMLLTGKCEGTRMLEGADLFKATLDARCLVGGSLLYSPQQDMIRLPGTFVAPWQWGWFLIANSFLVFPSAFNDPKPQWRIIGLIGLGTVFVLAVVSGQRIALALVPIAVIWLLIVTGQVANLKRFLPTGIGLGLLLTVAALKNPATVQERIDSFVERWNASPPYAFILEQAHWAMNGNTPLGHGLGRATNSARALGHTELVETYYPKLLYEIGPLGTLAFIVMVSTLTYLVYKTYRSVKERNLRAYGAAIWAFTLFISYNTYYYPLDVDPVAVYYWVFAGAALKLPEIERLALLDPEEEPPPDPKAGKKGKKKKKKKKKKRR